MSARPSPPAMRRRAIGAGALLSCAVLAAVPVASQGASHAVEGTQTLELGAWAKNVTGYAGPAHTSGTLPSGALYVAEVSGTISYWAKGQWRHPSKPWSTVCGAPLLVAGSATGTDAEFVFARPWTKPCSGLPLHWNNFEISTTGGIAYSHPQPLGGPFTAPTPEHRYSYPLIGSGHHAKFRLRDDPNGHPATADNYGKLTIHVRPADAADCAAGGYVDFGEPTEVACVAAT